MKIVDMLAAGLPVCALDYGPCLDELVVANENGWLFEDAVQFSDRVREALRGFPESAALKSVRAALRANADPDWSTEWTRRAAPVLLEDAGASSIGPLPARD